MLFDKCCMVIPRCTKLISAPSIVIHAPFDVLSILQPPPSKIKHNRTTYCAIIRQKNFSSSASFLTSLHCSTGKLKNCKFYATSSRHKKQAIFPDKTQKLQLFSRILPPDYIPLRCFHPLIKKPNFYICLFCLSLSK